VSIEPLCDGDPMNVQTDRLPRHFARLAGIVCITILVAACTAASANPSGATNSQGSGASRDATGSAAVGGFYLRAWQTQALAAQYTFGWLPAVTISDGAFYDGMVAVPAIYPGPLYVGLSSRTITAKGTEQIVAEARTDGLLAARSDFSDQALAGSTTCHVQVTADGATHDLSGPCGSDGSGTTGAPGSSAAFAAFWGKLTGLSLWLGPELGVSQPYTPMSVGVLAIPPADATAGIAPNEVPWPLATPFASFGSAVGSAGYRCAAVSGADLQKLLPVVQAGNALTRFVDSQSMRKSLEVRVLLPGEPAPC
jgi:hypothetical protein